MSARDDEAAGSPARLHPLTVTASALDTAELTVVGRLLDASNVAVLVRLDDGPEHAIYKPVAGERPLWDFPDGHLAHREVAAWLVSAAGGWDVVPPTVLREGPFGPGSVQAWVTPLPDAVPALPGDDGGRVDDPRTPEAGARRRETPLGQDLVTEEEDEQDAAVRLFAPEALPPSWRPAFTGELSNGAPVIVAHADTARLRSLAVVDAVVNNSDRKGSHVLTGRDGRWYGIDHGVTFHEDDKLRTVLWGWAGDPIPAADLQRLRTLRTALTPAASSRADGGAVRAGASAGEADLPDLLNRLLTVPEVDALVARVDRLLALARHPRPSDDWPAIPWPPL